MLTADELDQFEKMLRMIQARLRGDVQQLEEEAFSTKQSGDHGSSNHFAEMGTDAWDLDFCLRRVEDDEEVLSQIAVALDKIRKGRFGRCEQCLADGKPEARSWVPKARLKAIPYARNCVNCERELEKSR